MGFRILGHRGNGRTDNGDLSAGKAPENTLLSFEQAIDNGAHGVEFDIIKSKDGVAMVTHKPQINGQNLADLTADEIQKIDLGYGQHVPTLDEALLLIISKQSNDPDKKLTINIDLKGPNVSKATAEVINRYTEEGLIDNEQVYYNAIDWRKLVVVRDYDSDAQIVPVLTTGFLFGESNVQKPDFHVEDDVKYDPNNMKSLIYFIKEYRPTAIDMVLADIRPEMFDLMDENGIGLITTPIGPKREEAAKRIFNIVAMIGEYAQRSPIFVAMRTDDIAEGRILSDNPITDRRESIERIMGAPFIKL